MTVALAGDLATHLTAAWHRALARDADARAEWRVSEGGGWSWDATGARLDHDGEWAALTWDACGPAALRSLRRFVIEITVEGQSGHAGLSLGAWKDFLAEVTPASGPRRLQLEVDQHTGCWSVRVDGQHAPRAWWDSGLTGRQSLTDGTLSLKSYRGKAVRFRELAVYALDTSCQLSVIATCNRFLQRLRVTLRNWCHQTLPAGALEVIVVNPESPDGTHEHLAAVAAAFPRLLVREVAVPSALARNKGAMINAALDVCHGDYVWLTDADCLFAPSAAAAALAAIGGRRAHLFYGERRHLGARATGELLAGSRDAVRDFDLLATEANDRPPLHAPWGYTQIVHRTVAHAIRYHENHDHFAHSDGEFTGACRRRGIYPLAVDGLFCLHLDHPFAWYGTDSFL